MNSGEVHMTLRKSASKRVAPFPHPEPLRRLLDKAMYILALAGPVALLPQVLDIYRTKDVSNLALVTWCSLSLINMMWVLYGSLHKEYPIVFSSLAFCLMQLSVVVAIFLYS